MAATINEKTSIYEVSQLISSAKLLLSQHFSVVWVIGEISNLSMPNSGHVYFSLKDSKSQIRCALFSQYYQRSNLNLKEGMQVLIRSTVSIYEARGDFQLVVDHIELAGEGRLRQAFEQLKAKLHREGLFDPAFKKDLPKFPQKIGVITSSTGAAIRDVLAILNRRFSSIPVIIYPVLVQGELAAGQIATSIERANERMECDVLLLCRGGGSIEDLWPFNEEIVARAIFKSHLPIVTGIGHEVDFTIADFVADVRAPTPSGATVLAVPDSQVLQKEIQQYQRQLMQIMRLKLDRIREHVIHLEKRLQHPQAKLNEQSQKLFYLRDHLIKAMMNEMLKRQNFFQKIYAKWEHSSPLSKIELFKQKCQALKINLERSMHHELAIKNQRLEGLKQALDSVSPLNTLKRGYAIALKAGVPLTDAAYVKPGEKIKIKLAHGELDCIVS